MNWINFKPKVRKCYIYIKVNIICCLFVRQLEFSTCNFYFGSNNKCHTSFRTAFKRDHGIFFCNMRLFVFKNAGLKTIILDEMVV